MYYYKGEFTLKTNENDTIESLNAFLMQVKSRQWVQKRPYKRSYKYALMHRSEQGTFIDSIFDMGETIHCKPHNSIVRD